MPETPDPWTKKIATLSVNRLCDEVMTQLKKEGTTDALPLSHFEDVEAIVMDLILAKAAHRVIDVSSILLAKSQELTFALQCQAAARLNGKGAAIIDECGVNLAVAEEVLAKHPELRKTGAENAKTILTLLDQHIEQAKLNSRAQAQLS